MKITYVTCFGTPDTDGNPAAVVEDYLGDDFEKQQLATKLNLPVTVFVNQVNDDICLRFFYPATEMPLCIHGVLAAAYILMERAGTKQFNATTKDLHQLTVEKIATDTVQLEIKMGEVLPFKVAEADLDKMLATDSQNVVDTNLPLCVATVGSPKLLVPLMHHKTLALLKPNFDFIIQWSKENNINGLYVYTAEVGNKKIDFIARGFNPKGGSHEDAATGVAAGALYTALGYPMGKTICISQGEFINRPSYLLVSSNGSNIFIGGKVRIVSGPENL